MPARRIVPVVEVLEARIVRAAVVRELAQVAGPARCQPIVVAVAAAGIVLVAAVLPQAPVSAPAVMLLVAVGSAEARLDPQVTEDLIAWAAAEVAAVDAAAEDDGDKQLLMEEK